MAATARPPPPCTELGGSGLAGARHIREEREKGRRWDTRPSSTTTRKQHQPQWERRPDTSSDTGRDRAGPAPQAPRGSPRQRRRLEDTHTYLCAKVDPVMGSLILALVEGRPANIREAALRHLSSFRSNGENIVSMGIDSDERVASPTSSPSAPAARQPPVVTAAIPTASGDSFAVGTSLPRGNEASSSDSGVDVAFPTSAVGAARVTNDTGKKRESVQDCSSTTRQDAENAAAIAKPRLARRQDRIFMAREIGPLITELINRTLRCRPPNVVVFLMEQLQGTAGDAIDARRPAARYRGIDDHHRGPSSVRDLQCDHQQGEASKAGQEVDAGVNQLDMTRRRPSSDRARAVSGRHGTENRDDHEPRRPDDRNVRPSTARSRLQEAQSLDQCVQQTSPPLTERGASRTSRSPRVPSAKEDLSDDRTGCVISEGVRKSRNTPWDIEVSSKAILPKTEAQQQHLKQQQEADATRLSKGPRVAVILLLGLDGAGKTSLLGTLQGERDPKVRPSVGFKPVTMMLSDQLKVKFYDLGGGQKIRGIWDKYYHDAHGLLYVIDGADTARWKESEEHFLQATSHKYLVGKPVTVIVNEKYGGETGLLPHDVTESFGLSGRRDAKVCPCYVNAAKANRAGPDERLEGAVEGLLESVKERFSELNERVQRDLRDMEREFELEKERKQTGVMKGLLRKAFPEDEGGEREDCFDEVEGLEFLTSEVGLEAGTLTAEGAEVAALLGYQKLALQMAGNMKSPISRKNKARTWGEIRQLIVGLRREIGINPSSKS